MHFEVSRLIEARPEAIWAILTDAHGLASGAFGILRLEGNIGPGQKIKLWSEVSPQRAFPLAVTVFRKPEEMVWVGGMPLGAFTGTRKFLLRPQGHATQFHMRETYSGWLMPLMARVLPDLTPSFNTFADALKTTAERT